MPIYEYRCAECGFQKEYLQKVAAAQLVDCPHCGKSSYRKMLTAAGFHLKGNGWYATDFKSKSPAKAPKDESAPKSDVAAPKKDKDVAGPKKDKEKTESAVACGAGSTSD